MDMGERWGGFFLGCTRVNIIRISSTPSQMTMTMLTTYPMKKMTMMDRKTIDRRLLIKGDNVV